MALIIKDRVKETTTTEGIGTITLAGASTGFRSFADIGNANTTYYTIAGGTEWEVGLGTYTASGTTLSRDTVLSNSLGTTANIDFSAGTKDVFCTYPSGKALLGDTSAVASTGTGSVVLSVAPSLTGAVNIGGTTDTATLTLGRSTASQTINIGTGNNTGTKFINIGTASSTGANLVTIGKLSSTVAHDTKLYGQSVTVEASTSLNLTAQNIISLNTPYIYMPNSFGQNQAFVADLPIDFPTPQAGDRAFASDANNPRTGEIVSGGGTFITPIFYDGTNWICDAGLGATTGTGSVVLSGSPTFTTAITSTGALQLTGSTTSSQNIATSQTSGTLTIGGTGATGAISIGRSTGAQTVGVATGATASGSTKTMSIGTNGLAGSTTNITIGSTSGTSTTTLNGNIILSKTATPASATATGTAGTIVWDANYIYICTATNTWKRVAISTW